MIIIKGQYSEGKEVWRCIPIVVGYGRWKAGNDRGRYEVELKACQEEKRWLAVVEELLGASWSDGMENDDFSSLIAHTIVVAFPIGEELGDIRYAEWYLALPFGSSKQFLLNNNIKGNGRWEVGWSLGHLFFH